MNEQQQPPTSPGTPLRSENWLQKASTIPSDPESGVTPLATPDQLEAVRRAAAEHAFPKVPGYEILGKLGQGGMGVVYYARQISLKRPVALKMLRDRSLASVEQRARFRLEAEAVAQLQHPNIVQIFDIGEQDEMLFCSLEYVDGGALEKRREQWPMPPVDAAQLIETLARAMHVGHKKGIVHRDLKPGNVLLTAEGTPKIADFGLAKRLDPDVSGWTNTGDILGTPQYMAPEQAEGALAAICPATDVYALGAILYDLLSGRPPFKGETPIKTLDLVRFTDAPRLPATVPEQLENICLKCLRKLPEQRYASAAELADDLRRFQAGEQIRAVPMPPATPTLMPARLDPVGELRRFEGHTDGVYCVAFAPDGQTCLSGSQDKTVRLWDVQTGNPLRVFEGHEGTVHCLAFTADGRRFVSGDSGRKQSTLRLWDIAAGQEVRRWDDLPKTITSVRFSPDGKQMVTAADRTVIVWDVASGQEMRRLFGAQDQVNRVVFTPDSATLVAGSHDGMVRWWRLADGELLRCYRGGVGAVWGVALSADGRQLAYSGDTVRVRCLGAAEPGPFELRQGDRVLSVAFAPDGRYLLAGAADGTVGWWDVAGCKDVASNKDLRLFRGHTGKVTSVAVSPDGRRALSASVDKTLRLWGLPAATSSTTIAPRSTSRPDRLIRIMEGHWDAVTTLAFTPDGQHLLSGSNDAYVRLWEASTGQELRQFKGHAGTVWAVALTADGQRFISCSQDGTIRLWDLPSGKQLRCSRSQPEPVNCVLLTPDNRFAISAGDDQLIKLWDIANGQIARQFVGHTDQIWWIALSLDGMRLLSASMDRTLRLWDVASGQEVRRLGGWFSGHRRSEIETVAFAPNGVQAASGGRDHSICLWEPATGRELHRLVRHTAAVANVVYTSDGKRLLSAGRDGAVRLWDVATGQELYCFANHNDEVLRVAVSPDNRIVATGCADQLIRLWQMPD